MMQFLYFTFTFNNSSNFGTISHRNIMWICHDYFHSNFHGSSVTFSTVEEAAYSLSSSHCRSLNTNDYKRDTTEDLNSQARTVHFFGAQYKKSMMQLFGVRSVYTDVIEY